MSPTALGKPFDPPRRTERTVPADPLANALGWASSGLGVPQTTAPGAFARSIGVHDSRTSRALTRAVGVRELAASAGILSSRRPAGWLWARVAGDAIDLTLLGAALRRRGAKRERILAAMGAVAGITAADVVASVRATRAGDGLASPKRSATTVWQPLDEVRALWRDPEQRRHFLDNGEEGSVTYSTTPDGKGTEIRLELNKGEAAPVLRRFKQLAETGVIVKSDGSPDGAIGMRQIMQRPAQPLGGRTS